MTHNKAAHERHIPVLLDQVIEQLGRPGLSSLLDCTLGMGGHSEAFLERFPELKVTAFDQDLEAIELAQERLKPYQTRLQVIHGRFSEDGPSLPRQQALLADLGTSSLQLDEAERGFSFGKEGPLDMRMNQHAALRAEDIINDYDEAQLADIFYHYGEEPGARKIAAAIVQARKLGRIETTSELAQIVRRHARAPRSGKKGKRGIDPATRSFQGLRIAVNDELGWLERSLPLMFDALETGGRVGIISFHSLEDRIVKKAFRDLARQDCAKLINKKPLCADEDECRANPRARSAKFRVLEKVKDRALSDQPA